MYSYIRQEKGFTNLNIGTQKRLSIIAAYQTLRNVSLNMKKLLTNVILAVLLAVALHV